MKYPDGDELVEHYKHPGGSGGDGYAVRRSCAAAGAVCPAGAGRYVQNVLQNQYIQYQRSQENMELINQKHQIELTCVVNGALLQFMDVADICAILGHILDIAQKYGGAMTVSFRDNWFDLNVLIPLPQ